MYMPPPQRRRQESKHPGPPRDDENSMRMESERSAAMRPHLMSGDGMASGLSVSPLRNLKKFLNRKSLKK